MGPLHSFPVSRSRFITNAILPRCCSHCMYWKPESDGDDAGECRAAAPKIQPEPRWPVTDARDHCGTFHRHHTSEEWEAITNELERVRTIDG